MNRFLIKISAMMVIDSNYNCDDVAIGIAARLEEIAQSSEHLLDYEVSPYLLPEPHGPSHQRNGINQPQGN
jgi:hypothetical protein